MSLLKSQLPGLIYEEKDDCTSMQSTERLQHPLVTPAAPSIPNQPAPARQVIFSANEATILSARRQHDAPPSLGALVAMSDVDNDLLDLPQSHATSSRAQQQTVPEEDQESSGDEEHDDAPRGPPRALNVFQSVARNQVAAAANSHKLIQHNSATSPISKSSSSSSSSQSIADPVASTRHNNEAAGSNARASLLLSDFSGLTTVSYYTQMVTELMHFLRLFFTFQIILDPSSRFKKAWDYLIILLILYNAFVIPYYVSFDVTLSSVLLPIDSLCTVSMALDIMVTLRTGFLDYSGNMNYDSRAIAARYWNRGLILDLMGTFPMDIFTSLLSPYGTRYANLLKTNGLLRATRLAYNDRLASFNSPTARIAKLLFLFFYMAHLFAATFFFVAMVEGTPETWVSKNNLMNASLTEQYIASLYWSLTTMVTVGYGDIAPVTVYEQVVVIPILMLSALIYATIFSNMAYAIETITSTARRYQSRMDMVKEFISVYEIPVDLQHKLFDYTNAMWSQNKGFEIDEMLAHLPTSVKAEVMIHINESLIQRVPLLKQCSDRFLEAIILRMTSQVCLAHDFIFKQGDKSREMYFVRTGSVEIIMEDEETGVEEVINEIHSFSDCPFFGEISLLLGETRTASAKANTKCILSSLSQQDFFEVLAMFPDEATSLRETASERIQADVDREKAQLLKAFQAEEAEEDEDDSRSLEGVKRMINGKSKAKKKDVKMSKHETRLNALEMTNLTPSFPGAMPPSVNAPLAFLSAVAHPMSMAASDSASTSLGLDGGQRSNSVAPLPALQSNVLSDSSASTAAVSATSNKLTTATRRQQSISHHRRSSVGMHSPEGLGESRMRRLNTQSIINTQNILPTSAAWTEASVTHHAHNESMDAMKSPTSASSASSAHPDSPRQHAPDAAHRMHNAIDGEDRLEFAERLRDKLEHMTDLPHTLPTSHTIIHTEELQNLRARRDQGKSTEQYKELEQSHQQLQEKLVATEGSLQLVSSRLEALTQALVTLAEEEGVPTSQAFKKLILSAASIQLTANTSDTSTGSATKRGSVAGAPKALANSSGSAL